MVETRRRNGLRGLNISQFISNSDIFGATKLQNRYINRLEQTETDTYCLFTAIQVTHGLKRAKREILVFQIERHAWLVERARSSGRVDVNASAEQLGVTVETIRRDLNDLEGKNLLRRVHGGAIPIEGLAYESNLSARKEQFIEEKRRIAEAGLSLLDEVDSVFWDEGYMFQMIAEMWQPSHNVTVVTNAIHTASVLSNKKNVDIIFLGGRVRSNTMATADNWGARQLSELVLDVALIGANGISLKHGCTSPHPSVSATKAAAIKASHTSHLLALSNRFGFDSFVKFADISSFDSTITDSDMEEEIFEQFTSAGMKITRA